MMSAASTACSGSRAARPSATCRSSSRCRPTPGRRRSCCSGCAAPDQPRRRLKSGRSREDVMTRFFALALLAAAAMISPAAAQGAGDYPNRPIRIIVPFLPGGPADMIARFVGQKMSEDFGQPVVIENRAGGNTAPAAQAVARAAPDGYTLFTPMDTTMVMNPLVMSNLPYDPLREDRKSVV